MSCISIRTVISLVKFIPKCFLTVANEIAFLISLSDASLPGTLLMIFMLILYAETLLTLLTLSGFF